MTDFDAFLASHPAYRDTTRLDDLRRSDYARLDRGGHVYLDYTGAGLYGASQVDDHAALLQGTVFGNPHSASLTSTTTTRLVEDARQRVLGHLAGSAPAGGRPLPRVRPERAA